MKTVVITGPSSGIGRVTALTLGQQGYHIVAAGRSRKRTEPVVGQIKSKGGSAEFLQLDLSSLDAVRSSAKELVSRGNPVDILINNAGISMTKGQTEDGVEINFGVNHLGHFLFTYLLLQRFRPRTRIITLASSVHFRADGIDFDKLEKPSNSFLGLQEYAVSKLANVLFAKEMARRHPEWRTYAVHPGFVDTKIIPGWLRLFVRNRLVTPEQGAATTIWCAADPSVGDESGNYYARSGIATSSDLSMDLKLARDLWAHSELLCGLGQPK